MTVDANIIIEYVTGERSTIALLTSHRQRHVPLLLPTVVEAEVLSYPRLTTMERTTLERFLEENFVSISFDRSIARLAAAIRASQKIKLPDAAIAATALYTKTALLTRNVRDFKHIAGLRLASLEL